MVDETSPQQKGTGAGATAGQAETAPALQDAEALRAALAAEKARAESYLAGWQRAQADFINYKRRAENDKSESTKFANAMLILNLLPVLDDFQRALASVSASLAGLNWVEGVQLIYRKLETILESQGLTQIKAVGEKFDPHFHEAVIYKDGDEGTVMEELQRGYRLHDRVIRPALVVVGKGREKPPEAEPDQQQPPAEDTY